MKQLVLGLDIGITSVGYGIIDIANNEIVDCGVRLFKEGTAAENETRREKRGSRRLKSRKVNRIQDMENLLKELGIYENCNLINNNPYDLRIKGLSEKLTNKELTRVCLHYAKRRGSSLDMVEDDEAKAKELGETKKILQENDILLKQGYYVCQVQKMNEQKYGKIHGNYNNFRTSDYLKEAKQLLSIQGLKEENIEKILNIIQRKRQYYEGPGSLKSPTIYGRFIEEDGRIIKIDLIEKMRGHCSIYPEELRAPKMSYSAELFNFLNDLNNLKIDEEKITPEQKQEIISIIQTKKNITPLQLAKFLGVDIEKISGFRIDKKDKPILTEFKGFKIIAKVLEKNNAKELVKDVKFVDGISEILTRTKDIQEREESIEKLNDNLSKECIMSLANITGISGYHSLSLKAIYEMNEELLNTEMNQMQILHSSKKLEQKINQKGKKNIQEDNTAILSPVAKRAIRETIKVVNAARKRYGEFDSIVVETTRDKNSKEQKKRIDDAQKYFKKRKEEVDEVVNGRPLNAKTKEKIRLYMDQDGKCAYSLEPIDLSLIINDPTAYEIDHIIPISISLDDSFNNKVLVRRKANQDKENETPYNAIKQGKIKNKNLKPVTIQEYQAYVLNLRTENKISNKKKEYLLSQKDYTKLGVRKEFVNRNLIDTSYANRVVFNTLDDYFKQNEIPTKIHTIRGAATNAFRKKINLQKDREENYSHHAIDALIVASIKKLNLLNELLDIKNIKDVYDDETGEYLPMDDNSYFDPNYMNFINKLKDVKVMKFSHKIDTKPNRQIADDTIYSTRTIEGEEKLIKKYGDIYDPKFDKLTNDILNHSYQNKYLMAIHDPQTFEKFIKIIKDHYDTYKDDSKMYTLEKGKVKLKGENPLFSYKKEHGMVTKYSKKNNGPVITQMKYVDCTLGNRIDITSNYKIKDDKKVVLQQISPYRTDFYLDEDGHYQFVTVRYSNIKWKATQQCYIIDKVWYEAAMKKKGITSNAKFCFSMHHDELIGFIKEDGEKLIYNDEHNLLNTMKEHNGKDYEILKFTATNNEGKNIVEVKPIYKYDSKRLMITITNKFVKIAKFATDSLGNLYEVRDSKLKLEL